MVFRPSVQELNGGSFPTAHMGPAIHMKVIRIFSNKGDLIQHQRGMRRQHRILESTCGTDRANSPEHCHSQFCPDHLLHTSYGSSSKQKNSKWKPCNQQQQTKEQRGLVCPSVRLSVQWSIDQWKWTHCQMHLANTLLKGPKQKKGNIVWPHLNKRKFFI